MFHLIGSILRALTRFRRPASILLITLGALAVAGCSTNLSGSLDSKPEDNTGQLAFEVSVRSLDLSQAEPLQLIVRLTQDGQVISKEFPVTGSTVTGRLDGVFVGPWEVLLQVVDAEGTILYAAVDSIVVRTDQTATLDTVLTPAPGTLHVTVDLSNFATTQEVHKAKITLSPGELTESAELEEGTTTMELIIATEPKTYDVHLGLYKDTLHPYNIVYSSPWRQITIEPGKTTAVTWNPETGSVEIGAGIDSAPPAPTNLTGVFTGTAVELQWNAVEAADLVGYRLYLRRGEFDQYMPMADLSLLETSYLFDLAEETSVTDLYFSVSAFDLLGNESPRSPEWHFQVP